MMDYGLRDAVARVDQARANLGITQADQYPNFGAGGGFTSIESSRAPSCWASDWNRKTVVMTLISDVATAYFNLLELDMELAIERNTLSTRAESLRLIRTQLQGGVGTLLDVRQGEQLVYGAAQSVSSCGTI